MTTYVLVHGGGHGGWCYKPVAQLLRAAGHEVYAPTLTGLADRSHALYPGLNLDTHISDVVNLLRYEDLSDVVLAGHSYGGMVITGAADRCPERIAHLVYLDTGVPSNGQSLAALAPYWMDRLKAKSRVVDGVELVQFADDPLEGTPPEVGPPHFGVTDPALQAWMDERLTPHPWATYDQPLSYDEAALAAIPKTHVLCTATLAALPPEHIAAEQAAGRLFPMETGHDLMLTEPEATAKILLGIGA